MDRKNDGSWIQGKTVFERYPYPVRVPVEMRAFQKESAPIVFLLHVVNGFINELELVTADSSKIDMETIELDKVEYVINEAVKWFCAIKFNYGYSLWRSTS